VTATGRGTLAEGALAAAGRCGLLGAAVAAEPENVATETVAMTRAPPATSARLAPREKENIDIFLVSKKLVKGMTISPHLTEDAERRQGR
jgi:hypothetical protein